MNLIITEIQKYTPEILKAINQLLPQLSSSALPLKKEQLEKIIQSNSAHLLMAREGEIYLGCLTLIIFDIPTGHRALIEDVVVDKKARGKGLGKALTQRAIQLASEMNINTIDLTSRPSRKAANQLYKKIGFVQRDTNVYRYHLK